MDDKLSDLEKKRKQQAELKRRKRQIHEKKENQKHKEGHSPARAGINSPVGNRLDNSGFESPYQKEKNK